MNRFLASLLTGLVLMPASLLAARSGEAPALALFPFELIDAAQDAGAMGYGIGVGLPQGPAKDEVRRLKLITDDLARRINEDGRFKLIPSEVTASDVENKGPIHQCNGCEDDIAKAAGAKLALIATVEKLSDLLFNFKLYMRDVEAEKVTSVMSTTIQGSTDEAWLRGIRYLAERKLLQPGDAK